MDSRRDGQAGFVSIFAVLIIMTVLTLIAVGFSSITRNAERRTLDNQLNTQAFYAAESGVNDGLRLVNAAYAAGTNPHKATCQGPADNTDNLTGYTYDTLLDVGYSCVLIDNQPPSYQVDSVPVEGIAEPYVVQYNPVDPSSGAPVAPGFVEFAWDDSTGTAPLPNTADGLGYSGSSPILPAVTSSAGPPAISGWDNRVGILRVDITPNDDKTRAGLAGNSYSFFLYPFDNGSAPAVPPVLNVANGTTGKANSMAVPCSPTPALYRCKARVDLSGGLSATSTSYTLRMQTFYNPVKVEFKAFDVGPVERQLLLSGGQVVIDSTGRANDVFRRIKVHAPINGIPGKHEPFAVVSADSICKRMISTYQLTYVDTSLLTPEAIAAGTCDPTIL